MLILLASTVFARIPEAVMSSWFDCTPAPPEQLELLYSCQSACAKTDGCQALSLSANSTCQLHEPQGAVVCRTAGASVNESALVRDRHLIAASDRVAPLPRGQAYRYFSVVDDGSRATVMARSGTYPDASPPEHIVWWPAGGPELDRVSSPSLELKGTPLHGLRWMSHNFATLFTNGSFHVCGGRSKDRKTGISCIVGESVEGSLRGDFRFVAGPLMTLEQPGCRDNVFGGCEFDGKSAIVLHPRSLKLLFYVRMNTGKGRRFLQVASAPSIDGPFSPLQPVRIDGWDDCDTLRVSSYFAAIHQNPADGDTLLGVFPVNYDTNEDEPTDSKGHVCYTALAVSCDGVHFSRLHAVLHNTCTLHGRLNDLPVDGLVVRGDLVYFYVHRSMPTGYHIKEAHFAPALVRHTIHLDALRRWTAHFKAQLPSCPSADIPAPPRDESDAIFVKGRSDPDYFGAGCSTMPSSSLNKA